MSFENELPIPVFDPNGNAAIISLAVPKREWLKAPNTGRFELVS